jgi:NADH dehydrogenase
LCIKLGTGSDTVVVDAVGPQTVTFRELVDAVRTAVGSRALVLLVPGRLVPALSRVLSVVLRDTLLTRAEYAAMAVGLADSDAPSVGRIVFTDWVAEHGPELGRSYANELDLHFRPAALSAATRSAR